MADNMNRSDAELRASMNDFEAALTAKRVGLVPPPLESMLVVIDESNQTDMALGLARELAGTTTGAIVHVGFAYRGATLTVHEDFAADRVAALVAQGVDARQVARQHPEQPPYAQIIAMAERLAADLLIVPAPYLDDFDELGSDSIGVNLDKLMTQPRPLLVVREPRVNPADSLKPVLLALSVHVQENPQAAAWALRVIGSGGTIRLVAVVHDDVLEAAADLLGEHDAAELDLDRLAGLGRPETAGLIAEIQELAKQRGLGCRVSVRHGDLVDRVIELAEEGQRLIVTGCDNDASSSSYRSVQAIIRRATDPVLVI